MAKLTQAQFEAKADELVAKLIAAYGPQLQAKAAERGYRNMHHMIDACAQNEPAEPFVDGPCSDEAVEFLGDSIVGMIE